jgi:hypothetical protein
MQYSTQHPEIVTLLKEGKTYRQIQNATEASLSLIARVKEEIGMKPVGGRAIHPLLVKRNSQIANGVSTNNVSSIDVSGVTTSEKPTIELQTPTESNDNVVKVADARSAALEIGRSILAQNDKTPTLTKTPTPTKRKYKKRVSKISNDTSTKVTVQKTPITISTKDVSVVINGSVVTTVINGVTIITTSDKNTLTTTINGVSFSVNI